MHNLKFNTSVQAWYKNFSSDLPIDIINIRSDVFAAPIRRDIIQRVVVWERNCIRKGTHSTLRRGEVSGTGRKPWPQKGRGVARAGSLRAPHFRGGGVAHGPKPKDYSGEEIQSKVFNQALKMILTTKYIQDQLEIYDSVNMNSNDPKELEFLLESRNWKSALFLIGEPCLNLKLAAKQLDTTFLGDINNPHVYQMMLKDRLVLDKYALVHFEDLLKFY